MKNIATKINMSIFRRKIKTVEEKFLESIDIKSKAGCWEWKAAIDHDGYGKINYNKKHIGAHRLSYILHNGDIPEGMLILHKCDNPCCVNPKHLYVGTQSDNMNNMKLKKYIDRPNKGLNKKYRTLLIEKLVKENNEILLTKMNVQIINVIKLHEYSYKDLY